VKSRQVQRQQIEVASCRLHVAAATVAGGGDSQQLAAPMASAT